MLDGDYNTHFYCALCGGPFAQVFRTAVNPAQQPDYSHEDYSFCSTNDPADTDLENEFNKSLDENRVLPDEVVQAQMNHAARRARNIRLHAEEEGRRRGMMTETRKTWQAYDGRRISVKQMEWTKNLRALIFRNAQNHPLNYQHYLVDDQPAYLTGRGLIRQEQNWADGYASIDEDELTEDDLEDGEARIHTPYPIITEAAKRDDTYAFQLYQELSRSDSDYVISSIPFHDECWTLLDLAIEISGKERGIDEMNERLDMGDLWYYLRGLVGVSGSKRAHVSQLGTLGCEGRWVAVTRLGEVDYREAQGSGEGCQWKHDEGFHWLVADPSCISVVDSPLLRFTGEKRKEEPRSMEYRPAITDPFQNLPPEIILEVCKMLTSTDIFSLKTASLAVHITTLPHSFYRRFLAEEFPYLPTLAKMLRHHNSTPNEIDWRGSFERLRKLTMNPWPRDPSDEPGSEWDAIDIGLKNRNRIWKIVKPMADELVDKSAVALRLKYGAPASTSDRIKVVRGFVGARSGMAGVVESAYFGFRGKKINFGSEEDDEISVEVEVVVVRVWVDAYSGEFCGIGFTVEDAELGQDMRMFGRRSSQFQDVKVGPKKLAGFVFCLRNRIISGIQLLYDDSSCSERMGNFDGSLRKIEPPLDWRKLVGITGFINTKGFVESIGILEESRDSPTEDDFGPLPSPPTAVLPTHQDSSVWKKIPPSKVSFWEREGIHVMDWRLLMAEYEIWEQGFEEENQSSGPGEDKVLQQIIGYYDESSLRGLEFVYVDCQNGNQTRSLLGSDQADQVGRIRLEEREHIAAVVICYWDTGVHGILFVTEGGTISEVFGPRYFGTHQVYAPIVFDKPQTAFRMNTSAQILGLHGIYDPESRKFLQLGIVTSVNDDLIFRPSIPCHIPFDEADTRAQVWADGPPPESWVVGYRPDEKDRSPLDCNIQRADYSGYAALSQNLSSITIYGKMKGIRFSYGDGNKDRFFGHVDNERESVVQEIDWKNGEMVTGIAVLNEKKVIEVEKMEVEDDASVDSDSSQGDTPSSMQRLHFLTNKNKGCEPLPIETIVSSDYLVGIKFDFDYDQLVSWSPIYGPNQPHPKSTKDVAEMILYPWKSKADDIIPDRRVDPAARPICTFFDNEEGQLPIDAVKGYVNFQGKFCGLVFRRGGYWEDNVFGQRSAYEIWIELCKGEKITSIYLANKNADALALCTNRGRTLPWFGKFDCQATLEYRGSSDTFEGVGIYGTLDQPRSFYSIVWDKVGLLYRPCRDKTSTANAPEPTKTPLHSVDRDEAGLLPRPCGNNTSIPKAPEPRKTPFHCVDEVTGLPWLIYINTRVAGLKLQPLVARRFGLYHDRRHHPAGRIITLFTPSQLEKIYVLPNQIQRTGIKSIRFRGTKRMGLITMGEWPHGESVEVDRSQKMKISGLRGERITRIKVAFQKLDFEDRIVGITIETTHERSKTIISSEMHPEKSLDLITDNVKFLNCEEGHEIVGFHGIASVHSIHDIGLVLRQISTAPKLPRAQEGLATGSGTPGNGH